MEKKNQDMIADLKLIFNESFNIKNKVNDLYDFVIEGDISDHEPNPIDSIDSTLYSKYILEYL